MVVFALGAQPGIALGEPLAKLSVRPLLVYRMADRPRYIALRDSRCGPSPGAATDGLVGESAERGANLAPGSSLAVVAMTNGLRADRDLRSELIVRIASGDLGAKLRSQVASWHSGAGRDDVEEVSGGLPARRA